MAVSFTNKSQDRSLPLGKLTNEESDFSRNEFYKLINALEIDWNGAVLSDGNPSTGGSTSAINDTSQLLELINSMQKEIYVLTEIIIEFAIKISNHKYYWYIGTENLSSISNIQTDNTVPGWHEIGLSLTDFILDTNNNPVHISETRVPYYVIIPNDLHIYNGLNMNIESITFETITCNILGYKAFKYLPSGGSIGVRDASGIIIK